MSDGTAVATVAPNAQEKAVQNVFTPQGLGLMTSLPLGSMEEKIAAAAIRADDKAEKFANVIGEEFTILDVVIHPVDLLVDEDTGEMGTFARTVLVTDRGLLAAVSTGLVRELGTLASLFGPAQTWRAQGGVRVKAKQLNTRRGFRTYALVPVVAAKKSK